MNKKEDNDVKIVINDLSVYYDDKKVVKSVNLNICKSEITSLIGPSGCGKSTILRCLNRMNDVYPNCHVHGNVLIDDVDIYRKGPNAIDVTFLRSRVGMVFQKPNPFPKSIFENVAYGLKIHGLYSSKGELKDLVEESLAKAGLLEEVHSRLHESALKLSGGQQQRLCIARAIAIKPEVLLMDEPCSALDPIATAKVESLLDTLRQHYTIVIVTHSMQQAGRVSQQTAFFHLGELIEAGPTQEIFTVPKHKKTQDYITGRVG